MSMQEREEMFERGQQEFAPGASPACPDDVDYMDGWCESQDLHEMSRRDSARTSELMDSLLPRGSHDRHVELAFGSRFWI